MEIELRSALLDWLRDDPQLWPVNTIAEERPNASARPTITIAASAARDWGSKDRRGRAIRIALELQTRTDLPGGDAEIAEAIERRVRAFRGPHASFVVSSVRFLRGRHHQRSGNRRTTSLEFQFHLLEQTQEKGL